VRESSFFFHDQLVKLAAPLVLTGAAVVLYWRRQGRYRKLVLIAGGLVMGIFLSGYLIVFLGGLVALALLWGRVFCEYVCPVGAIAGDPPRIQVRECLLCGWCAQRGPQGVISARAGNAGTAHRVAAKPSSAVKG